MHQAANPLVRGFNPLKNVSQLGLLFPIYGKIKHVPNHQPAILPTIYLSAPTARCSSSHAEAPHLRQGKMPPGGQLDSIPRT